MRKRQCRSRAVLRKTRRRLLRFQVRTTNRSRKEKLPAGWVKQEDGSWKYRKEDGTMAASEWITHLNRRYYLNADEIMCTGLSMVNGKLYYFESWGGAG